MDGRINPGRMVSAWLALATPKSVSTCARVPHVPHVPDVPCGMRALWPSTLRVHGAPRQRACAWRTTIGAHDLFFDDAAADQPGGVLQHGVHARVRPDAGGTVP